MDGAAEHLSVVPPGDKLDLDWTMPIDFAILANLPKQGSRLGYHVLGATVKNVLDTLGGAEETGVSSGAIGQRITRWLLPKGLVIVVRVHGSGGGRAYQITPEGERVLEQGRKEGRL